MSGPRLIYFDAHEFVRGGTAWHQHADCRLLVLLDTLRHAWGEPIEISQDPGAVGRHLGDSPSWHNVDAHRRVFALDVIPSGVGRERTAEDFVGHAIALGFTGIGFYPDWRQGPGFHLDTRTDRRPGDPALWGAIARHGEQVYRPIGEVLEGFV